MEDEYLLTIMLPVYNEEEAIGPVLDGILKVMEPLDVPYELLVVDDGSTDGTCAILHQYPQIRVVTHDHNRGNGAARTTGVKAAKGKYILMTDADGTYPADAIPQMLEEAKTADMVIGARTSEKGTLKMLRSLAKNLIRWLASYMTQTHIPDLNSGMRIIRRDLVPQFFQILPTTHSWVSTITMAFLSSGYTVKWMPIAYYKRIGRSTFHPIRDTYNYLTLVVRTVMYFNPLRAFIPISLVILLVGFGKMIYDIISYNWHFAPSTVMLMMTW
ncbi:MAG: glycosyltransferase family 2 protein, partial [Chloroflexi bacterium]|nr:glycosyltransferase family 2 protein [Chloroflexota bacterium]